MRSLIVSLVLLGSVGTTLAAQEIMSLPQAKMQELQPLVGVWEGGGWLDFPDSQRREFTAVEEVESKLDGLVLTMELMGKGMLPDLEEYGEIVFHHSFGVATYDGAGDRYRMATFREDGSIRVVDLEVSDGAIEWSYDDPELGTVRNTMRLTESGMLFAAGSYQHESGWRQFYNFELKRVQ